MHSCHHVHADLWKYICLQIWLQIKDQILHLRKAGLTRGAGGVIWCWWIYLRHRQTNLAHHRRVWCMPSVSFIKDNRVVTHDARLGVKGGLPLSLSHAWLTKTSTRGDLVVYLPMSRIDPSKSISVSAMSCTAYRSSDRRRIGRENTIATPQRCNVLMLSWWWYLESSVICKVIPAWCKKFDNHRHKTKSFQQWHFRHLTVCVVCCSSHLFWFVPTK